MARLRKAYGAGPLHLAALLGSMAVAALAVRRFFDSGSTDTVKIFAWLAGSVVVHDLIFVPLYSLPARILSRSPATSPGPARLARERVHLRIPAMLSGLLLLVFFPLILRTSRGTYGVASKLSPNPYLHRWLIATAVLFGVSGAIYAVRVMRARRRRSDSS